MMQGEQQHVLLVGQANEATANEQIVFKVECGANLVACEVAEKAEALSRSRRSCSSRVKRVCSIGVMCCTAMPSTETKRVRKASWRATICSSACCSAGRSSLPCRFRPSDM